MRILFITASRVGDAVLSTGLLDHLLRAFPEARFTIVCGPAAAGVFARMPRREETYSLTKRRYGLHWPALWWHTARRRWGYVVDLRGGIIGWVVWTPRRRVMRDRKGPKIAQLAAVLRVTPPPLPVAWFAPEDEAWAAAAMPAGRPAIVLGPTANWDGKIWPAERFARLFRALRGALPEAYPVVIAGPGEAERARATPVLAALPEAVDLVGQVTLAQAAACFARARLFVGNDSGLMHLAAAAGAPTLGLFGPTPAAIYRPAGPLGMAVAAADGTMAGLAERQVLEAALLLLRQSERSKAA
jgi:ADP-heptose:LPS heptosyltransferase